MRRTTRYLVNSTLMASAVWLGGCFLGSDDGPSSDEKKQSAEQAGKASGNLQDAVARMQGNQYEYGKEDLTTLTAARDQYAEAARLNPGNSQAQMGLALTNILYAAQDPRLADVLNRTIEGRSPFSPALTDDAVYLRPAVLAKVSAASEWPEFHEIQDSIEKVLLPALEDAIARIRIAYNDPAFSMTLTLDGSTRELDHVEAGILLAGVQALHGLVTLWLSYDLDIDYNGSYEWIEALEDLGDVDEFSQLTDAQREALRKGTELLAPDAPFLTVRPAWKEKLSKVDDEISSALDVLRESLGSLAKETDAQDDDLIHLCGAFEEGFCMPPSGYQEAKDGIDSARKYMKQPYEFHLEDIDTTIRVDFTAYFRVQDYKKLLPYYGFYDPAEWSDEKPALYFTDKNGNVTGNIMTLKNIADAAEANGTPAAQVVDQFRAVIHLQDPTMQGFLPGATEAGIWNLLRKQAEFEDEGSPIALRKDAVSTLRPDFALRLIGK